MSLSTKEILSALKSRRSWISRNTGTKEDPSWENHEVSNAQHGDVVWFSSESTEDDIKETQRLLAKANLHLYSKNLAEGKDMMLSKSGSFSFLALPNQS